MMYLLLFYFCMFFVEKRKGGKINKIKKGTRARETEKKKRKEGRMREEISGKTKT